jgi:hypothetical protein
MWTADEGGCVATSFRRSNTLTTAPIPIKYENEWVSKSVLSPSKENRFLLLPLGLLGFPGLVTYWLFYPGCKYETLFIRRQIFFASICQKYCRLSIITAVKYWLKLVIVENCTNVGNVLDKSNVVRISNSNFF